MSKYIAYRKYQTREEAQEIIPILEQNGIACEIEDTSRMVSEFIVGQDDKFNIMLKILPEHFEKANTLLGDYAQTMVENADPDHYLFGFENQELLEIIAEPDAWSEYDYHLAKKILTERGIPITKELETTFQAKRNEELTKKEDSSKIMTTWGYISAFLGGVIGIAIGLNLWTMKKTLPNGERVYVYNENDRRHGKIMTVVGIIVLLCSVYIQAKIRNR
jgi:hypothetical protein